MNLVGIDVGGTNVRVALVNVDGRLRSQANGPTDAERGAEASIALMIELVRAVVRSGTADGRIAAIGIGITGPVDAASGIVANPFTLAGWPPTDLRRPFAEAFEVPVAIDNDANAAAVGEWWMGAGQGASRLAMVTVGTGIGAATLIDGHIQRAADGRHGEAGHMVLNPAGPPCYCGANGCWEALASGTAIGKAARERAWRPGEILWRLAEGDVERVDGKLLLQAALGGDDLAVALVDETAAWLGLGLVNLAAVFMPERFVIAGGVAEHLDLLRPGIESVLRRHAVMIPCDVPVVAAALGADAGPIGAAKLAMRLVASTAGASR